MPMPMERARLKRAGREPGRVSGKRTRRALSGARTRASWLVASLAIGAVAAIGASAGCGRSTGSAGGPAPASQSAGVQRTPAWQVRAAGGQRPIDPGVSVDPAAPPSAEQLALLDAETCRDCHSDQHAEWAESRHSLAWTNGIFQREYSAQPRAWCVNCHAPLTVQQAGLAGDARFAKLADQGVSCAACHVRGGALVSGRKASGSPHATVVEESFGSPAMCADCHQFTFPVMEPRTGEVLRMTAHPMQTTVSDFLAGPYAQAERGCLTCHGTAAGHGFPGGHDLTMLRAAISASWCRTEREVVMEVGNVGAGHRVPTGDIHRHLVARFWRSSAPESTFEAFFGRRYEPAEDGGKRITWDSTLAPKERRRFAVPLRSLEPLSAQAPVEGAEGVEEAAALRAELEAEPINFEVVYVYTIDEFPRRDRAPSEPWTAQLVSERRRFEELPRCDATAPAPAR
jgi:Cytochrome c554 and c-prime